MTIAAALLVFAVGAILRFAVTAELAGIDLAVAGLILMIIGAVSFVVGLVRMFLRRRTEVVSRTADAHGEQQSRTSYLTPTDPDDPRW